MIGSQTIHDYAQSSTSLHECGLSTCRWSTVHDDVENFERTMILPPTWEGPHQREKILGLLWHRYAISKTALDNVELDRDED